MKTFEHRRKKIEFWNITGEVLDSTKHSETHVEVTSSGGGGVISRGTGYVAPPRVSTKTTTTTKHEFWIRTDNGKEIAVTLSDVDIPLRPSQRITLLCAKNAKREGGYYCSLINHNAGQHWEIEEPSDLLANLKILSGATPYVATLGTFLFLLVFGKFWVALAGSFGLLMYVMIARSRVETQLSEHIEGLIQEAYQSATPLSPQL